MDLMGKSVPDYQFRMFKKGNVRRCFRLETIFWDALEKAAKGKRMRIGQLIFAILETVGEVKNATSVLRCYAMLWQESEYELLKAFQDDKSRNYSY